jgi:hypothetical protein
MPGTYAVRVSVPGDAPMTGRVLVEADPLPRFTAADRASRQATLMRIYDWTKTIGAARAAARSLTSQRDSLKADLGAPADSLNARIARASGTLDRSFNEINGLRAPIEGWSGVPTVDQQKLLGFAIDDARKAMADLNRLSGTEVPAAYRAAGKTWTRSVPLIKVPGS